MSQYIPTSFDISRFFFHFTNFLYLLFPFFLFFFFFLTFWSSVSKILFFFLPFFLVLPPPSPALAASPLSPHHAAEFAVVSIYDLGDLSFAVPTSSVSGAVPSTSPVSGAGASVLLMSLRVGVPHRRPAPASAISVTSASTPAFWFLWVRVQQLLLWSQVQQRLAWCQVQQLLA